MESKITAAHGQVHFLPSSPCPTALQTKHKCVTSPCGQGDQEGDQGTALLIALTAGGLRERGWDCLLMGEV